MIVWSKIIGDLLAWFILFMFILLLWSRFTGKSVKELLEDFGELLGIEKPEKPQITNKFDKFRK